MMGDDGFFDPNLPKKGKKKKNAFTDGELPQ